MDGGHLTGCHSYRYEEFDYGVEYLSNIGFGEHRLSFWLAWSKDGTQRCFPFITREITVSIIQDRHHSQGPSTTVQLLSPKSGQTYGSGRIRVATKIENWPLGGTYCIHVTKSDECVEDDDNDYDVGIGVGVRCFRNTLTQHVVGILPGNNHEIRITIFDAKGKLVGKSEQGSGKFSVLNATQVTRDYHMWYSDTVGASIVNMPRWKGVNIQKSVSDLWVLSEILYDIQPTLVIEFGTLNGGSALWFADTLRTMLEIENENHPLSSLYQVFTVDVNLKRVHERTRNHSRIEMLQASSVAEGTKQRISELMMEHQRVFVTLDSAHSMKHVLNEMEMIAPMLRPGDYLLVEDTHHNGHPIAYTDNFGPGPYEAVEEFDRLYPNVFWHDTKRETKFGFTWNPNGFLIKK